MAGAWEFSKSVFEASGYGSALGQVDQAAYDAPVSPADQSSPLPEPPSKNSSKASSKVTTPLDKSPSNSKEPTTG